MASYHILDMSDKCLAMVCQYLDLRSQCNFAFACQRFKRIYELKHKNTFRCFNWFEAFNKWSHFEINAFFKLNGCNVKMMTIYSFVDDLLNKEMQMINACVYLKNLHSLIISVNCNLSGIITEICKHMTNLRNLTIDSITHSNYEPLVQLPRLYSLDIQNFVKPGDRLFEKLAETRPDSLKYLRIGSELTVKLAWHIAYLRGLEMLNIFKPERHFINCVVFRLSKLRVLSLTNARQLQANDLKQVLFHLKQLSSLYVCICMDLNNDFVFFVVQFLKQEASKNSSARRLPLSLGICNTAVSNNINQLEPVASSFSFLKLTVVANPVI